MAHFPPIDYNRVFTRIPEIMGLDLTFKNRWWEGQYYIHGRRHDYKKDKLKVKLQKGTVWIYEQGGESMTLLVWLVQYGGCADYKSAFDVIRGGDRPVTEFKNFVHKKKQTLYVPRSEFDAIKEFPLEKCPLFRWMCTLFREDDVRACWEKYNVTTDSYGNAVYWFVDKQGNILHDKRIPYSMNGHRNKKYGAFRKYKVGDGYDGVCYFGEHLIKDDEEVLCAESEKDALIITLCTGRTAIATGGKSNLREIGDNFVLLPDRDAVEEWEMKANGKGKICRWWEKYPECDEHDGVGDYLIWRRKMGRYL